jgi:CheY-like chemotaxis protein
MASLRVLVADGYADSAESLAWLLSLWGCQVQTVHTGTAALEATPAFRPDVALVDLVLPEVDGCEVARRLRGQPGLLLAAVTGLGDEPNRRRAREAGFAVHLLKPVEPDDLYRLLARTARARDERFRLQAETDKLSRTLASCLDVVRSSLGLTGGPGPTTRPPA